jgi:hypothetical protein
VSKFDIREPVNAYIFGFMQADGHHYAGRGRKGRISVEIKAEDADLLRAMQAAIPWRTTLSYRTRATNFSKSASSAVLNLCALEGRTELLELGLPIGRKSATIAPPVEPFSHSDYLRGVFDADGSVGFTAKEMPFLSLVTASPALADFACAEILDVTGATRTARPNKRDGVMNIMVGNDAAALLAAWLYQDACLALARKHRVGLTVAAWRRPASMRAAFTSRRWTTDEDATVLRMPIRQAARMLGRTEKSVNIRRWRLRHEAT